MFIAQSDLLLSVCCEEEGPTVCLRQPHTIIRHEARHSTLLQYEAPFWHLVDLDSTSFLA